MNSYKHLGILFHVNESIARGNNEKVLDGIVDVPYMCGEYRESFYRSVSKLKAKNHIKKLFLWYGGTAFRLD